MRRSRARWYGMMSWLAVLVLATGCFQQSGSPSNVTPISQALPSPTPIEPSDTPVPPPTDTPVEEPTTRPLPTASPTEEIEIQQEDEGTGGSAVEVTSPVVTIPVGTPIAQAVTEQPEPIDPLNMTATAIIQRATQTMAANLTATWAAQFGTPTPIVVPTSTPLPGVTPTLPQTTIPGGPCTHVVVAGDNLFRISMQYGVPINDIAAANGISNPSIIVVGQVLTIPGCNGGTNPVTPGVPPPGGNCTTTYTTQQGDTLFQISLQFGVPVNSIAAANNITNINLIFINQQLCIPPA